VATILVGRPDIDREVRAGLVAAPPPTPLARLFEVAFDSVYETAASAGVRATYSTRVTSPVVFDFQPRFSYIVDRAEARIRR